MVGKLRTTANVVVCLALLGIVGYQWGGPVRDYAQAAMRGVYGYTPVSLVVAVAETADFPKLPKSQLNIRMGPTANMLRASTRWHELDPNPPSNVKREDAIPKEWEPVVERVAGKPLPYMLIYHGSAVTWEGQWPQDEEAFSALVKKQGGL